MFPIDSIKASLVSLTHARTHTLSLDADAGVCCVARGGVHGHRKCVYSNIRDRGHARTVARRVLGHTRRRTSPRNPFWHLRSRKGTRGRQPRWKSMAGDVCVPVYRIPFTGSRLGLALAGASATIASDALMNPFDGEHSRFLQPSPTQPRVAYSHQTTDAGTPIRIPFCLHRHPRRLSHRRPRRVLRVLSDDANHVRPVHGRAVHSVRAYKKGAKSQGRVLARDAHDRGRDGGWCRCWGNDATRCGQDALANTRHVTRSRDSEAWRYDGRA